MARLREASVEHYGPLYGEDAPLFLRIYSHRPPLADLVLEINRVLRSERVLPDRLLELVRLRVAFWNQCRSCMAGRYPEAREDGLTEELVCSLERPEDAEDITERERAAIAYADLMATDHLSVDERTFDGLREHFSEPEIMELAINVAYWVGFGRLAASLHMVDDLPERFRADGRITPWGGEVVELAPVDR